MKVEAAWVRRFEAWDTVVKTAARVLAAEMVALAMVIARAALAVVMAVVMAAFSRGVVVIAAVATKAASARGAAARLDLFTCEWAAEVAARPCELAKVAVLYTPAMVAILNLSGFEQAVAGLRSVGSELVVAKLRLGGLERAAAGLRSVG